MSPVPPGGQFVRDDKQSTTYEGGVSVAGFTGSVTTTIAKGLSTIWYNREPRERQLCGESRDIAGTQPTRIRSLP